MVLFSPAIGLAQAKARALCLCLVRGCQPIAPHHCPAHATVAFRACPARAPVPASARASAREHRERRRVRRLPKGGEPALLRPVQPGARMFGAINLEHCAAARALLSTWAHARAPCGFPRLVAPSQSFHLLCLSPPLDAVPEGDWLCPICAASPAAAPPAAAPPAAAPPGLSLCLRQPTGEQSRGALREQTQEGQGPPLPRASGALQPTLPASEGDCAAAPMQLSGPGVATGGAVALRSSTGAPAMNGHEAMLCDTS